MPTVSQILQERLQNALRAVGIASDEPLQLKEYKYQKSKTKRAQRKEDQRNKKKRKR